MKTKEAVKVLNEVDESMTKTLREIGATPGIANFCTGFHMACVTLDQLVGDKVKVSDRLGTDDLAHALLTAQALALIAIDELGE